MLKQLGDGTYGSVWKAINRQSNEVVRKNNSLSCCTFIAHMRGGYVSARWNSAAIETTLPTSKCCGTPAVVWRG